MVVKFVSECCMQVGLYKDKSLVVEALWICCIVIGFDPV